MQEENNKLFIGNLSYDIDDDQLLELFSSLEEIEVTEAKVITDRYTGKPRGIGFVTVGTPEMAQKAIELMNNKEVAGREIFVNIARPQTRSNDDRRGGQRDNRGGGYGGGRNDRGFGRR